MKKIAEKFKQLYNSNEPQTIEWIIAVLIGLLMILMFAYIDGNTLTVWSTNLLDCIADGNITNYYTYTALNKYNLYHQYVSGPLYCLFMMSVWNIPIWIIQYFFNIPIITSPLMLIWSKLFLVFQFVITLIYTYKISNKLFKDKNFSKWIIYLAATFIFSYIGIYYSGQTDITICMFAVLALYYLVVDKKTLFYIFSAIAISIKYFFLLPFIPILLLIEKKIGKIFLKLIGVLSPLIIFEFIVQIFPDHNLGSANNNFMGILSGFFSNDIAVSNGYGLSLFFLVYIFICFAAYLRKCKNQNEFIHYTIYYICATYVLYFMTSTYFEFYRPILLMPFLMILYGYKPKYFRINLILDTIMSGTLFIQLLLRSKYLLSPFYSMNDTILSNIFGVEITEKFSFKIFLENLMGNYNLYIKNFFTTIAFAAFLLIIIINNPKFKFSNDCIKETDKPERWLIWLRGLIVVPILVFLLIYVY